jgi:hypothetical protein
MSSALLDRLDEWKRRFGSSDDAELEELLAKAREWRPRDAAEAIRLHETLLFLRAYPRSAATARLADSILFHFDERVAALEAAGADLSPFEEPEASGIAGTSLTAVFSYEVARRLAATHPRSVEIGWERYDEADRLGPVLERVLPLVREEWPVEAHVPFRGWIRAARGRGRSDLGWLLERLAELPERQAAELYESASIPLTWEMGQSQASRSKLRLGGRKLYCHREPLLRRGDISLARELEGPPLPVRRLDRAEARQVTAAILETSAMRYRELYGFSHPDVSAVYHADAGRATDIYFFGVPAEWRLPLRAYHGGMFFKNGVPAGYVEVLSLFDRAEVGFNLYYTFREGESAWLYGRLLRLFRQVLGVNCFSVDPYQIGHENPEAIDSGAFWFYRKLGFRPVKPELAALVEREERAIARTPGRRSSRRTLEKLAAGYLVLDGPGAEPGAWDGFRVQTLGLAAQRAEALGTIPGRSRWTPAENAALAKILEAKGKGSEARYLRLMQGHARLRAEFQKLGSE